MNMKKILSLFLIAVTFLLAIFSTGCKKDEKIEYYNYGLHYKLPEEYRRITQTYSEFIYYNGEAYFYFNTLSQEQLVENGYDIGISVYDYAFEFAALNGVSSPITYDPESKTAVIEHVYAPNEEMGWNDSTFFYWYFLRGSQLMYTVTLSGDGDKAEKYKPVFEEFVKDIKAD